MSEAVARTRPAMSDPRLTAVKHAVKVKALAQLAREIGIGEALAVIRAAAADTKDEITPRELAAAGRQSLRDHMVAELIRHEQQGRGRDAPMRVARDFAADARDPVEIASLARKLRRWRRQKFGQCPITADENG